MALGQIHPEFFIRMQKLLGDEYPAFVANYSEPAHSGLRVNTLKVSAQEYQSLPPFELSPLTWCPTGFLTTPDTQPGKHPHHAAGLYYLQEPSAMAVAEILDPKPGEHVLDLSAAPGGKTTHLAALMQNQGWIVANEIHPKRAWDLAENLERCGVRIAAITNETPERLAAHFGAFFDRLLLDAPCSGEGMFRKSEAARTNWNPGLVHGCALRQKSILDTASHLVKPGGWLVYSTCTFSPEENENVIAQFLEQHTDFVIVPPDSRAGYSSGMSHWVNQCKFPLERTVRIWPQHSPGEGHYIALLQRSNHSPSHSSLQSPQAAPTRLPAPLASQFDNFVTKTISDHHFNDNLALVGSYLYQIAEDQPRFGNLRLIHPGWWLGSFKKDRFEPSHALALGLNPKQAKHTLNLGADDPLLFAYLRGESFTSPGENGWILITVDGFPLGWGKRVQGTLKNAYPRGLRWK